MRGPQIPTGGRKPCEAGVSPSFCALSLHPPRESWYHVTPRHQTTSSVLLCAWPTAWYHVTLCQYINSCERDRVIPRICAPRLAVSSTARCWQWCNYSSTWGIDYAFKCFDWIPFEEYLSNDPSTYISQCCQANILPLPLKFKVNTQWPCLGV